MGGSSFMGIGGGRGAFGSGGGNAGCFFGLMARRMTRPIIISSKSNIAFRLVVLR